MERFLEDAEVCALPRRPAWRWLGSQFPLFIRLSVARSISSQRDRYQATVILHAPLDAVADRVPHAVGTLEAIDDRSCRLRTGSDWLGGLTVYIADIGVDFTVVDPPELATRVRELAARFTRAVEKR